MDDAQPNPTATRVNAWLDAHAAWIAASPDRLRLAEQWRTCARMFGAESDPARGVLLGLVRLALGKPHAHTMATGSWRTGVALRWACWIDSADFAGTNEVEALLAALESAP